ncbi:MAG TPA: hypothetical protein VK462_04875 [Nitrososphaeraceae archaeon]|nr:hypothetical protein [Nitrososphaeraceae archaeon]
MNRDPQKMLTDARKDVSMLVQEIKKYQEDVKRLEKDKDKLHDFIESTTPGLNIVQELLESREENKRLREAFGSRSVYKAIRHYQKQGLCEDNEYDELDKATNEILQGR